MKQLFQILLFISLVGSAVANIPRCDFAWTNRWLVRMEVIPRAHQLTVSAAHPSGIFTTNASVWFTNNATRETVSEVYDAMGQTTQRVFKSASGAVTRTQNLAWDSRGRLDQVRETDSQTNGYIWLATYDGLGRRWYTFYQGITNGDYVLTGYQTTGQYYDPEAEFLELGVTAGGLTTWKLYGPDLNGRYGGLNGVGGLEAFTSEEGLFNPVIADARGNVIGSYDPQLGNLTWNSSRPTGYGAAPGYRPVPLGHGGNVAQSSAWRGRWPDITGFVCLGARYYNSESGTFLSSDPVWNGRDPNYYSFCGGDPINSFDPDGRFGVQSFHSGNGQLAAFEDSFINGTVGLVQLALYGAGRVIGSPELMQEGDTLNGLKSPMQRLGLYTPGSLEAQIGENAATVAAAYGSVKQIPSLANRLGNWWDSLWSTSSDLPTPDVQVPTSPNTAIRNNASSPKAGPLPSGEEPYQLLLFPDEPYNRVAQYGITPTAAQRASVPAGMEFDHNPTLVQHYYEGPGDGTLPGFNLTQTERVQYGADEQSGTAALPATQRAQGGAAAQYSREQKFQWGLNN